MFSDAFEQLLTPLRNNTRSTLLAERNQQGFWEGELSSSALSTATALCALEAYLQVSNDLSDPQRITLTDMITRGRHKSLHLDAFAKEASRGSLILLLCRDV